jgi:hypothetical protein
MLTPKIKALFQFIEFLHSNIDRFKQYDEVIKELHLLNEERHKPRKNFADKLKYDKVQAELKDKFKVIHDGIIQPIQSKVKELNICDLKRTEESLWGWYILEIDTLKNNFSQDDLPEIFTHRSKYLEYRIKTGGEGFFELGSFFPNLDEILKILFDYFKDTDQNEFEPWTISVNDTHEADALIQQRLNSSIVQQSIIEALPLQPITKQKSVLKIDQIALKFAYEDFRVTRESGNEIAKRYGHNSGEKLFQRFTYFSSAANRKGKPTLCTPKKIDNKIKLIESIIELLPTDKQERAKDEVSILRKIYETEYQ